MVPDPTRRPSPRRDGGRSQWLHRISAEDRARFGDEMQARIDRTNAQRGVYVLPLGIVMELFLILVFDIANIREFGWVERSGGLYLALHAILLIVSVIGTWCSFQHLRGASCRVGLSFRRMGTLVMAVFLAGIALINGLDQASSDSITLYLLFTIVIAVLVVVPIVDKALILGVAYVAFLVGQLAFQGDPRLLEPNLVNGTLGTITALAIGAYTYRNAEDFTLATLKLEEATSRLEELSFTDQLTGVANRRRFEERVELELARSGRTGSPFCLVLFDIDHFKQVNDTRGHQVGDRVLTGLADRVAGLTRRDDSFARIGGEEFVVLLSNTSIDQGVAKAESIRAAVAGAPIHEEISITISVGVTECTRGDTADALLSRSDKALYEAKNAGRNQVRAR